MQFHILSFEGPDAYSRAGGIASRVVGLSAALAVAGYDTHLWFVGDPDLPGEERCGNLTLHRWCQWISRYHPNGVYEGEEGKQGDYAHSLPPFLVDRHLAPYLRQAPYAQATVLGEEWHTANAVLHLDTILRGAGLRSRVTLAWNANNTFCFDRIDWGRLSGAAVITTVSRYMKQILNERGVAALAIPNGIDSEALATPERGALAELRRHLRGRPVLAKVARWDPDKRWLLAMDIVGEMKCSGRRPLLIARGGVESHGNEVMARAAAAGLQVVERHLPAPGARGLVQALSDPNGADVVDLRSPLDADNRRLLFRAASAVLANSGHEPFGLVGLETMAAGGVACTGCSGEDYALPGENALVLQTDEPREFLTLFDELHSHPWRERALRRAGRATARRFTWPSILERTLLPRVRLLAAAPTAAHA